jgi:hypothetical protein
VHASRIDVILSPPFVENSQQSQLISLGRLKQVAAQREFGSAKPMPLAG